MKTTIKRIVGMIFLTVVQFIIAPVLCFVLNHFLGVHFKIPKGWLYGNRQKQIKNDKIKRTVYYETYKKMFSVVVYFTS